MNLFYAFIMFFASIAHSIENGVVDFVQVGDIVSGKVERGEYIVVGLLYSDKESYLFSGIDSFSYFPISNEKIVVHADPSLDLKSYNGCYVNIRGNVEFNEANGMFYLVDVKSINRVGLLDVIASVDGEVPLCIIPALVKMMNSK